MATWSVFAGCVAAAVVWVAECVRTAQRARNSSIYGVCVAVCRLVGRAERSERSAPMHTSDPARKSGCLEVFKGLLNGDGCGVLCEG